MEEMSAKRVEVDVQGKIRLLHDKGIIWYLNFVPDRKRNVRVKLRDLLHP